MRYGASMSAVFLFRLAIALAAGGSRIVTASGGPSASTQFRVGSDLWHELTDPLLHPEDLAATASSRTGYSVAVADIATTFDLRLAQCHITRDGHQAGGTDDAICTHHFIKLAGEAPAAWDDAADLPPIETALLAFYTQIGTAWPPAQLLSAIRWYRAGPQAPAENPPIRVTAETTASTGADSHLLPPQVAMSVTEKTSDPKSWGRFYLPTGDAANWVDAYGRFSSAAIDVIRSALVTLTASLATNHTPLVVYSAAKASRTTKGGTVLDAAPARALAITGYQVDDIADVIRSRRWQQTLIRGLEPA